MSRSDPAAGRSAGDLVAWIELTRAVANGDADADVPGDGCVACCASSQFVHVAPDDRAARAVIPAELLFPAPGRPSGHLLMGYDDQGRCPMLVDEGCSIYDDRPRTCRDFDCRVFAATGVAADPDKPLIADRAQQWRFDLDTEGAPELSAALRAAAQFVVAHRHDDRFRSARHSPTGHAVLAVELHDVFRDTSIGNDEVLAAIGDRPSHSDR